MSTIRNGWARALVRRGFVERPLEEADVVFLKYLFRKRKTGTEGSQRARQGQAG